MPSPTYQYVVNLVVTLTIRGGPGVFMNVPVREYRALNHQIFLCGQVVFEKVNFLTNLEKASLLCIDLPSLCYFTYHRFIVVLYDYLFILTSSFPFFQAREEWIKRVGPSEQG